jgi:hypothetical protein
MTKPKTYVSAYAGGKRVGDLPKTRRPGGDPATLDLRQRRG